MAVFCLSLVFRFGLSPRWSGVFVVCACFWFWPCCRFLLSRFLIWFPPRTAFSELRSTDEQRKQRVCLSVVVGDVFMMLLLRGVVVVATALLSLSLSLSSLSSRCCRCRCCCPSARARVCVCVCLPCLCCGVGFLWLVGWFVRSFVWLVGWVWFAGLLLIAM